MQYNSLAIVFFCMYYIVFALGGIVSSFSITKHNDLITSAYRLSLTEMQIILYGVSLVNPVDGKFPRSYEINIKKFGEMFNRSHKNIYSEVKEAIMKRFWEREFTFHDKYETNRIGELVRARVKWVTTVKYSDKAGFIKIFFNPEIEEYLHNLKASFTTYYIAQVSKFRRFYSVRFYEIAVMYLNKSKVNKTTFNIKISDIRDILELKDKYRRFASITQYVLKPSMNEINTLSDLKLSYDVIKIGRTPHELRFSASRPHTKGSFDSSKDQESNARYRKVSCGALEKAKILSHSANTGWDIYAIEQQFYSFMKSKGVPDNIDGAFIGFVKKKIVKPPR